MEIATFSILLNTDALLSLKSNWLKIINISNTPLAILTSPTTPRTSSTSELPRSKGIKLTPKVRSINNNELKNNDLLGNRDKYTSNKDNAMV